MGPQLVGDSRFRYLVWEGRVPAGMSRARLPRVHAGVLPDDPPLTVALLPGETALVTHVLRSAGLSPEAYRSKPFRRRIPACLRALNVTSSEAALEALRRDPSLQATALDMLVNTTTSMFRDAHIFATLRHTVVPELASRPRLRILSVGCSSGAELASVAVLLDQAGALAGADLHGIDCRPGAINAARRGVYSAREIATVSSAVRRKYLSETPEGWALAEAIRNRLSFHVRDALGESLPHGPWDMVLCRNVSIYLARDAAAALWRRLAGALAPAVTAGDPMQRRGGGYLVVGHAERVPADCGLVRRGLCVYRRERN